VAAGRAARRRLGNAERRQGSQVLAQGLGGLALGLGQVVASRENTPPGRSIAELVGHVGPPLPLGAERQPVDDDVQKAADTQAQQGQDRRRQQQFDDVGIH